MPSGRPSEFTQAKGDEICERLINGESLRKISLADDMPHAATICRWLAKHETFREQYVKAREAQADTLADEILDIADNGTNDWMADKEAEEGFKYNGDAVQRSRLRVDARKWLAGKMRPKVYGDKVDVTSGDKPIVAEPGDIAERTAALLAKAALRKAKG